MSIPVVIVQSKSSGNSRQKGQIPETKKESQRKNAIGSPIDSQNDREWRNEECIRMLMNGERRSSRQATEMNDEREREREREREKGGGEEKT